MICPRCGAEDRVLDTREAAHYTIRRRRECHNGHRFSTVEMHMPAHCSAKQRLKNFAETVQRRIALWKRDQDIANELHLGWRQLAERYELTKTSIYLAAQRGRKANETANRKEASSLTQSGAAADARSTRGEHRQDAGSLARSYPRGAEGGASLPQQAGGV